MRGDVIRIDVDRGQWGGEHQHNLGAAYCPEIITDYATLVNLDKS